MGCRFLGFAGLGLVVGLALGLLACSSEDPPPFGSGSGSGSASASGGDLVDGGATSGGFASELCPDGCACSDGIDNDMDGVVDGADGECTGPYDDDEGTFATGIPGDNVDPKWQDCFFDGNSGAGDDGCRYATECLTGELAPDDPDCAVADQCLEFCRPRTPNGCDCFGCCEVPTATGELLYVSIGSACSLENIGDENACPRCVQQAECQNECGRCELCPGKTEADLPADCVPDVDAGIPAYTCEDGIPCGVNSDCPETAPYCSLGCCLAATLF